MLILRALGLLLIVVIGVLAGLGLMTRQPLYFRWAWTLFRYGLATAIVFVALFLLERLIAPLV